MVSRTDPVRAGQLDQILADSAQGTHVVRQRRLGIWLAGTLAVYLGAFLVHSVATNKNVQWSVMWEYFVNPQILDGLYMTLGLTAAVTGASIVGGAALAAMRLSGNPVLQGVSWLYTWFFRGVPLLVQLLFWFNLSYLYPRLGLGIPFGPTFVSHGTNELISALSAGFIGLTLHIAAHAAEIIRGGILGVDQGQVEAAQALALPRRRIFLRIQVPQAMRSIVPQAVNLITLTLQATSIVSIISVADLLYRAQEIYAINLQVIPLLVVATVWYLLITSLLTTVQYFVERHFAKGALRTLPLTPLGRLRSAIVNRRIRRHMEASSLTTTTEESM